jgi:hypothetical protein
MSENAEKDARIDILWKEHGPSLDYHFCRSWDGDVGCYGTNPEHGFTFAEAKKQMADHYRKQAEYWDNLTFEEWVAT